VWPSSKALAEAITSAALENAPAVVVEFGPGTGAFTEMLLARLPAAAQCFAIEINGKFVEALRQRCPGAQIIHDSAVNTRAHLANAGLTHCDAILSGLPWAAFDDTLQDRLLAAAKEALRPGGRLVTFAYVHSPWLRKGRRFRDKLRRMFRTVTVSRTIWRNMPPAFLYIAKA